MNPADNIYFLFIGSIVFAVCLLVLFLFRKRFKLGLIISGLLIMGVFVYYLAFPTIKTMKHTERYDLLLTYLNTTYPNGEFEIYPKPEEFNTGYPVGDFRVNRTELPSIGVGYYVAKDGSVNERSTWSKADYPSQENLWKTLEETLTTGTGLNKTIPDIVKRDSWIDGKLSVFAVSVDDYPAIALYNYSPAGYGTIDYESGKAGETVVAEYDGKLFVFIDERSNEDSVTVTNVAGTRFELNVAEHKGKLVVLE